ncbi:MAG TPA: hypothetical protein VGQ00_01135 [Candidatus Norongarragalinales archaeon]|jgi:hypothetical protein|nr:hypothetical protein [Candidatus Norongarragalinales archaeon]
MGISKADYTKRKNTLKAKLEELEKKARNDPLKKDRVLHEEIADVKKKLAELDY